MHPEDPVIDVPKEEGMNPGKMTRKFRPRRVSKRVEALKEQIRELKEKVAAKPEINQTIIQQDLIRPLPPQQAKRPEGIMYHLEPINKELEKSGDPFSVFPRVIPSSSKNPELPDPRICVFCFQNVAAEYKYDISDDPTPQQAIELKRLHAMHMKEAALLRRSDNRQERRHAADHLELKATMIGRVPDVVARLSGKEWSSEEWNERRKKEHEAKLVNFQTSR